jgi:hypothetical protein
MLNATIFALMAVFAGGMIFSPLIASADPSQGNFLDIEKAVVDIDKDVITDIVYKTRGFIPQDGSGGAFGYGVITAVPSETPGSTELNVIATTSHPGVLDSQLQGEDKNNPIIHNHYVILGDEDVCDDVDETGRIVTDNPSVFDLSFTSPGKVFVQGNEAIIKNLPASAEGQITGAEIIPGTNIQVVASFLLEVRENEQEKDVVCVTNVMPVEPQDKRTVIFGEKDFKPDYPRPGYENSDDGYENANGYEYSNEMSYEKEYDHNQRY